MQQRCMRARRCCDAHRRYAASAAPHPACECASAARASLPYRHREQQVKQVTKLNAEESCPFVGESLRILRSEVGNDAAVLGFVGA